MVLGIVFTQWDQYYLHKNTPVGAREIAHQLRIHTVLAEDLCSGPSTRVGRLTMACNSSFRGSEALF